MKSRFNSAEKIMDRYGAGLVFPFHINHALKQSGHFYHEDYTEFHEHDFYSIILRIAEEPKAFYLTEDDKEYYSQQEFEVIEKIKERS